VPAARLVGDDNDAFGLDYAELAPWRRAGCSPPRYSTQPMSSPRSCVGCMSV